MKKFKKKRVLILTLILCLILSNGVIAFADESKSVGNGNDLYSPLTITGNMFDEEEEFNAAELNTISEAKELKLSLSGSYDINGTLCTLKGINLLDFLTLCNLNKAAPDNTVFQFYSKGSTSPDKTVTLGKLKAGEKPGMIALPQDQKGSLLFVGYDGSNYFKLNNLRKILVSSPSDLSDPHYGHHLREPLKYMQDLVFTVNMIDKNKYSESDGDAVPFKKVTCTLKEIEQIMLDDPKQVQGNYFGMSGNETSKSTMGLGGFFDYYEGLNLSWFLKEKAGLDTSDGYAVFYGRDNDKFGKVSDLSYFFPKDNDYSDYYLELTKDISVNNVTPIIAVSKNGYPLLPMHDHEMKGHVSFNKFHDNAIALGYDTEIGLVKNVSGPFVAGLPNLDGVYGGYRYETSGDCIRIDLYVNKMEDNKKIVSGFKDVSANSWYAEYVKYLTEKGIVSGTTTTTFDPDKHITRAEFVKMIAGIADANVLGYDSLSFTDVSSDAWYARYTAWADNQGIIKGIGDAKFNPDGNITRQDMAVIIDRYASLVKKFTLPEKTAAVSFEDSNKIARYAYDSVSRMQKASIISGKDGNHFAPYDNATRAEASKMLAVLMQEIGK